MDDAELDELDHQVAAALGGVLDGDGWRFDPPLDFLDGGHFIKTKRSFCRDWSYGGPVIEHMLINIDVAVSTGYPDFPEPWVAYLAMSSEHRCGRTPLIAAMRAFVAAKENPTQGAGLKDNRR